MSQLNKGNQTI